MKYRAEIDGLRALAVLPVILFHAGFESFSGGFVGVDIFFVISGYLITTLIISEMAEDRFSIINFYKRRARRILPALFFMMAVCLPFAWLLLIPNELKDFGQSLVSISIFSSNILFWIEDGYFDAASELKPLLHTWSLAVEEQYYVMFPIFLILTWRLGIKWIVFLLSIVFVLSLGLAEMATNQTTQPKIISAAYFLLPTRGWELLVGVFAAFYLKNNTFFNSKMFNQMFSLIGIAMILYSVIVFDKSTPFPSLYTLVPVIGTALLILCSVQKTLVYNFLTLKPIVGLGLISYSAYLWHQPLFAFMRHSMLEDLSDFMLISLCAVSLILAWLSYRFIETPFRDRSVTPSNIMITVLISGTIAFTSLGLLLHFGDGFESRLNYGKNISTIEKSPKRDLCHSVENPCQFFEGTPKFATFGDSHVVELSYALAEHIQPYGYSVQQNSFSGCSPNLRDKKSYCYEWTEKSIDRIVNDTTIETVVVSYKLANTKPEKQDIVWEELLTIIEKFSDNGKKVYFLIQPPLLDYSVPKQILLNGPSQIIGPTRNEWINKNKFIFSRYDSFPKNLVILDAADVFCDDSTCYGNDGDGFYYYDDNHISMYGARKIVEYFSSHFDDDSL